MSVVDAEARQINTIVIAAPGSTVSWKFKIPSMYLLPLC